MISHRSLWQGVLPLFAVLFPAIGHEPFVAQHVISPPLSAFLVALYDRIGLTDRRALARSPFQGRVGYMTPLPLGFGAGCLLGVFAR